MKLDSKIPIKKSLTSCYQQTDAFLPLKNLPNMVCALCGKPMINNDTFSKTLIPLGKPLLDNINSGVLSPIKRDYPLVWQKLLDFTHRYPDKSIDDITGDIDVYLELKNSVIESLLPEKDNLTETEKVDLGRKINNVFYDTIDLAHSQMKPASIVVKGLLGFKKYLDGLKKSVFEQFEIYSRKYPDKTLSEIVKLPEVHKFHCAKNILQRMDAREKLDFNFENIELIVGECNPEAVDYFKSLKEDAFTMLDTERDPIARLYKIKDMYKVALQNYDLEHLTDKVMEEIDQIPQTLVTKDSFFDYAYNHHYSDGKIVTSIFGGMKTSEEHIKAISDGGTDAVSNRILMHRHCNSIRGTLPYTKLMRYYPDFPQNVQAQVEFITQSLLSNNLPSYLRTYPVRVVKNLKENSEGIIDINVEDYCRKMLMLSDHSVGYNNTKIEQLIAEKRALNERIGALINENVCEKKMQVELADYVVEQIQTSNK